VVLTALRKGTTRNPEKGPVVRLVPSCLDEANIVASVILERGALESLHSCEVEATANDNPNPEGDDSTERNPSSLGSILCNYGGAHPSIDTREDLAGYPLERMRPAPTRDAP